MVTLPHGYADIDSYAQALLEFIHRPLSVQITGGIHVNDAFIYDAWDRLPTDWTCWWKSISDYRDAQKDLINSLRDNAEARSEELPGRPETLSRWLEEVRGLSLSRKQIVLSNEVDECVIPESLTAHMNTKKSAEVRVAARYIQHVCRTDGVKRVIDIGSGQGYLSLILAAVCGLKVLAIDGSAKQIQGSKTAAQLAGLKEGEEITHLVRFVDGSSSEELRTEFQSWSQNEACILVGLHACGSLSEHMVRLFANTPNITHLAAVGCCYNHIKPLCKSCPDGFPISQYMRDHDLRLSASAMITGCQAPTNWVHNPDSPHTRKYFYRAVLEKLLHDKTGGPQQQQRPVWGIRTGDLQDFSSYSARALDRLGLTDISESEIAAYETAYRGREGETAILWTLSVLLCRVVESIIALDRWFFLAEAGTRDVRVLPIFDYEVSPRNLMIAARKRRREERRHGDEDVGVDDMVNSCVQQTCSGSGALV